MEPLEHRPDSPGPAQSRPAGEADGQGGTIAAETGENAVRNADAGKAETAPAAPAENGRATPDAETPPGAETMPSADTPSSEETSGQPDHSLASLRAEYPGYFAGGRLRLPSDALQLMESGLSALEACRLSDLRRTRARCRELQARLDARQANRNNAAASTGTLAGESHALPGSCSPQEWDALSSDQKNKLIRSGKVYEFMRAWGGRKRSV